MRPGRPRSRAWHDVFRLVPDPRSRGAETAFIDRAARPQGPTHALRQGPRGARIPHDAVRGGSPGALADTCRPPLPPPRDQLPRLPRREPPPPPPREPASGAPPPPPRPPPA